MVENEKNRLARYGRPYLHIVLSVIYFALEEHAHWTGANFLATIGFGRYDMRTFT